LQDADNLDAIGAIGIARTFCYSGYHNVPMYNDKIPINNEVKYSEGRISPSTIHHFYEKLLKQGEYMNTKTAKEMAKERTEFMKKFVDKFLEEWEGNF